MVHTNPCTQPPTHPSMTSIRVSCLLGYSSFIMQNFIIFDFPTGHQVISSLTQRDSIAVLGVANSIVRPAAPCMRSTLVPATHDVKQTIRHFVDYMEIENGLWGILIFFCSFFIDNSSRGELLPCSTKSFLLVCSPFFVEDEYHPLTS